MLAALRAQSRGAVDADERFFEILRRERADLAEQIRRCQQTIEDCGRLIRQIEDLLGETDTPRDQSAAGMSKKAMFRGRVLSRGELKLIRREVESFEEIDVVDDE